MNPSQRCQSNSWNLGQNRDPSIDGPVRPCKCKAKFLVVDRNNGNRIWVCANHAKERTSKRCQLECCKGPQQCFYQVGYTTLDGHSVCGTCKTLELEAQKKLAK